MHDTHQSQIGPLTDSESIDSEKKTTANAKNKTRVTAEECVEDQAESAGKSREWALSFSPSTQEVGQVDHCEDPSPPPRPAASPPTHTEHERKRRGCLSFM